MPSSMDFCALFTRTGKLTRAIIEMFADFERIFDLMKKHFDVHALLGSAVWVNIARMCPANTMPFRIVNGFGRPVPKARAVVAEWLRTHDGVIWVGQC